MEPIPFATQSYSINTHPAFHHNLVPHFKPGNYSCPLCPAEGKSQRDLIISGWDRDAARGHQAVQRPSETVCLSILASRHLWAKSQEDRPLGGSPLWPSLMVRAAGVGAWRAPLPGNKCLRHWLCRGKKQLKLPASILLKSRALHREKFEQFWSCLNVVFSLHSLF